MEINLPTKALSVAPDETYGSLFTSIGIIKPRHEHFHAKMRKYQNLWLVSRNLKELQEDSFAALALAFYKRIQQKVFGNETWLIEERLSYFRTISATKRCASDSQACCDVS